MGDVLVEEPSTLLVFKAKEMFRKSFQKLEEFFLDGVLCDVEIRIGSKSIKCHRVVLACCSPYFRAMFTSSLNESRQRIITISDIDELTMELLIKFVYTAKIELTVENVQSLLHAASVLQLDVLAQACCSFMKAHLHPSNCLEIRQFAERLGHMGLVYHADIFACLHFQEVVQGEEFLSIGASHLQDIICSPDLCVDSEIEVYEAVLRWIKHSEDKRKGLLPGLLSKVRLAQLPTAYLRTVVELEDLIRCSLECRDLLDEARDYQLWEANLLPGLPIHSSDTFRPRKNYAGVLFCVGGRGASGEPFSLIECYSWLQNRWFRVSEMTTKRRHVGCTSVGGKVYAVGGCNDKLHLATAEVFDPKTNQWTVLSPMSVPRRGIGLCYLGGPLYAVGGLDDSMFFATVERYDITSDTWTCITPMNLPRGGVAVAVMRSSLMKTTTEFNSGALATGLYHPKQCIGSCIR